MMLSKNCVIELWSEFGDIPTQKADNMATVIDENFLGWPAGTDVETIWYFFDEQFKGHGGVHALKYENPQPDRKFQVVTPAGIIECYSKIQGVDMGACSPGVFIDIRRTPSQLAGKELGDEACCVEYDSGSKHLQTVVYQLPPEEEPTYVEVYEPLMTYGQFLSAYNDVIDVLEIFDTDGNELPEDVEVPDETPIISMSRCSGIFSLEVDLPQTEKERPADDFPERISIYDVRRGLTDGDIVLVNGDDNTVVAEIGGHRVSFGGNECEGVSASMHIDTTYFEDDVQSIYEALNAAPNNGKTADESKECLYVKAHLNERFRERDAAFEGRKVEYTIEDQIAACYAYLNWPTGHKDPYEMSEDELQAAEKELAECEPGFSWVAHAGYVQMVPQDKRTGVLILG